MIKIFVVTGGYGYQVTEGGMTICQEHKPAVPGRQLMTIEEADRLAKLTEMKLIAKPGELPSFSVQEMLK